MNVMEVIHRWPTQESAIAHLERVRWHGHPVCPYCHGEQIWPHASKDKKLPRWQCQRCRRAFSVTVGTIFHHTHLPLQTWFLALAIMLNVKKNVSNAQLARDLGLPYKTAWALALRIREAMLRDPEQQRLFQGIVEMDEVYLGGKPRPPNRKGDSGENTHKCGRGTDKMPVVGIVERRGRAFAKAVDKDTLSMKHMTAFVHRYVDAAHALLITDQYPGYHGLRAITDHYTINHSVSYVEGETHTNTIDGFWA